MTLFISCSAYYHFDELYDQGEYLDAYKILSSIQRTNNIQYKIRQSRIILRMALNGDNDFISILPQLIGHKEQQLQPYSRLAQSYLYFLQSSNQNTELSEKVIESLSNIRLLPSEFYTEIYQMRGLARLQHGDYKDSINDFKESYDLTPVIENLYFIGLANDGLTNTKQAIEYFKQVTVNASSALLKSLAYFQMAEIAYDQSDYTKALNLYFKAVKLYPNSANYNTKIGKCLQQLGSSNLANHFFGIALRIQKDFANAWYFLNVN